MCKFITDENLAYAKPALLHDNNILYAVKTLHEDFHKFPLQEKRDSCIISSAIESVADR